MHPTHLADPIMLMAAMLIIFVKPYSSWVFLICKMVCKVDGGSSAELQVLIITMVVL